MNDYYKILGVSENASKSEIKKAYFSLIRKHSPESDPEMFQKIRHAYEQLQDDAAQEMTPKFPPCSEDFGEKMLKEIRIKEQQGDFDVALAIAEEACHLFPNDIVFQYYRAVELRECGYTGKSIKAAEKLTELQPENMWFFKELALSCMERGFTKKALPAFQKAYELGCRNLDFIHTYSIDCFECKQYERGISILSDVIDAKEKWGKDEINELIEIYFRLFLQCFYIGNMQKAAVFVDQFHDHVKKYRIYFADHVLEVMDYLELTSQTFCENSEIVKKIIEISETLEGLCKDEASRKKCSEYQMEMIFMRIQHDDRISLVVKRGFDAYSFDDYGERSKKFAILDTKLCMLAEREDVLRQGDILRQEYPDYFKKLEGFLSQMADGKNLTYLVESMKKEYDRMNPDGSIGFFYEEHPDQLPGHLQKQNVISDGETAVPYVRTSKKIGRNDPCPCGSGKKYKQCCMKK